MYSTCENHHMSVAEWPRLENRSQCATIDLSTARPKWRLDGPALSGHLLYLFVNRAYANIDHIQC